MQNCFYNRSRSGRHRHEKCSNISGNSLNSHPSSTSSMRCVSVCIFVFRVCTVFALFSPSCVQMNTCFFSFHDDAGDVERLGMTWCATGEQGQVRLHLHGQRALPHAARQMGEPSSCCCVIVCYVLYTEGAPVMATLFMFSLPNPLPGMCAYFTVLTLAHTRLVCVCRGSLYRAVTIWAAMRRTPVLTHSTSPAMCLRAAMSRAPIKSLG